MAGRIAVVGAGVVGLAAARRLTRARHEVAVFDKARGVGRRTSTRRRDRDSFDHGAQYFTCRTDAFTRQLDDWCRRGVAAVWTAPIRTLGVGEAAGHPEPGRRYVGVPGMNALARDLARALRVECEQRIDRVEDAFTSGELLARAMLGELSRRAIAPEIEQRAAP